MKSLVADSDTEATEPTTRPAATRSITRDQQQQGQQTDRQNISNSFINNKFWLGWLIFQLFFTTTTTGLSWFQYGYYCKNSSFSNIMVNNGNHYCTYNCVFAAFSTVALLLIVIEIGIQIVIITSRDTQIRLSDDKDKLFTASMVYIRLFCVMTFAICFTVKLLNYTDIQDIKAYTENDVTVFIDSVLFYMTCAMTVSSFGLLIALIVSISIACFCYS